METRGRSGDTVAARIECGGRITAMAFPDSGEMRRWLGSHPRCHLAERAPRSDEPAAHAGREGAGVVR